MIRTVAVVFAGVLALALALQMLVPKRAPATEATRVAAAPVAEAAVASDATKTTSRREQIARLVAETAAATADRTAHRVLAEKSGVQQTALR